MGNVDKNLEQMIQSRHQGASLEEAVREVLGEEIAGRCKEIEEMVDELSAKINSFEEKYAGMDRKMMIFQAIDEQCGEDTARQFCKISDVKFAVSLRNLEISKEKLEEQGGDIVFIREALVRTHEEEQEMAGSATAEEVAALKEELAKVLPEDLEEIQESIRQTAENEGWEAVLQAAEAADGGITPEARRDIAILAAAAYLNEHPEMSAKEAAAASVAQTSGKSSILKWLIICAALGILGFASIFLGLLGGIGLPIVLGMAELKISAVVLSGLLLLSLGKDAVKAVKEALPYVKEAWKKCRPHLEKAASKVKFAVASVIGVVANHVFRPAIYWINNKAVPVVKEKVIHPLRRRLERLLKWLKEKKDQVVEFVKNAAAPKEEDAAENMDNHEDSQENTHKEFENEEFDSLFEGGEGEEFEYA